MFPWPPSRPTREVEWHGWLAPLTHEAIQEQCPKDAGLIVECGSWGGLSTKLFLEYAPDAIVVCIDHWCQYPEQYEHLIIPPEAERLLPVIFDVFCANHWDSRQRIIPVRLDTITGLEIVAELDLEPDVVYLDSDHSTEHLVRELQSCLAFPSSKIIGDDYTHESVRSAVERHSESCGRSFDNNEVAFWSAPINTHGDGGA
jgi:hypothetical protein